MEAHETRKLFRLLDQIARNLGRIANALEELDDRDQTDGAEMDISRPEISD